MEHMISGTHLILRPVEDRDWERIEAWGRDPSALWGPYQRFQLDHVPQLQQVYQQMGLLSRDSGLLLVETIPEEDVVGFVRYTMIPFPDSDLPHPEIGFGIPEAGAQGKGYAKEAVGLLVAYLFAGYPVARLTAFTEKGNRPAQRVLAVNGFQQEGNLRRSMFRDGQWRDILIYGILREEFAERSYNPPT
jgi:RimJ/RimL family protein N-acetyltransferase